MAVRTQHKDSAISRNSDLEVLRRYEAAARQPEAALCCPTNYDPSYLKVIPQEILDRDYGCGDPTQFVREGDTVLDLGSGTGKACYIISQIVGQAGKVIGIDFNPAMLALAVKHREEVSRRIGWDNVVFHRAAIQDLKIDLDAIEAYLVDHPIASVEDLAKYDTVMRAASAKPVIEDSSIDIVISNCVLNLVRAEDKKHLFGEMYRVLRDHGRIAISDIVSDRPVPGHLKDDPKLWSGCISGAFQEQAFLKELEVAGFRGIRVESRDAEPWRIVEEISFRSITVTAFKAAEEIDGPLDHELIYKGPWLEVRDEVGRVFSRGEPVSVSTNAYRSLTAAPYEGAFHDTAGQSACKADGGCESLAVKATSSKNDDKCC